MQPCSWGCTEVHCQRQDVPRNAGWNYFQNSSSSQLLSTPREIPTCLCVINAEGAAGGTSFYLALCPSDQDDNGLPLPLPP